MAKKILIIDDEEIITKTLKRLLKKEGYDIAISQNGQQALEEVKMRDFNLIVSDVRMPQMDGIEASKSIRSTVDRQGQRLPILGLSANVNSSDRERFIDAGADDFLLKPYDRQTLVEVTERLLFAAQQTVQ